MNPRRGQTWQGQFGRGRAEYFVMAVEDGHVMLRRVESPDPFTMPLTLFLERFIYVGEVKQ